MNNNWTYPDPAFYDLTAEMHQRDTVIADNFQKQHAKEWVPEAIHTITLISKGRKFVHNEAEQCALMTCGAACVALGFSLLCFGRFCCGLGFKCRHKAAENVNVHTSLGFRYTAYTADIVQPAFDHFKLRFEALMAIKRPTRDQVRCRYMMVDWVVKTCTAMGFRVRTDLTPANVIDFLLTRGLTRCLV